MTDNIIKVNVTANKSQRVTVSSANVGTEITASSDTGKFWAQTSKNWAVSENIVDGEDYSSKYYANKSKGYAQNAESFEAATRETYDNFINLSNETTDAIIGLKQTSITEIEDIKNSSVVDINATVDAGIADINNTKTNIITDIEFVADGEKEEILGLADEIKDSAEDIINRVSLSMFDTILKDHVLSYEESRGLALQGTYVYKNAVAGSRYGYPDFYNKCLEEYQNATNEQAYLKSNVTYVGSVVDNNGVLSGFSTANYAKIPAQFKTTLPWEICLKFTTGSIGTRQKIFAHNAGADFRTPTINIEQNGNLTLNISTNGSSWAITASNCTSYVLQASTTYIVKAQFTGEAYILQAKQDTEQTFTTILDYVSNIPFYQADVVPTLGFEQFGSSNTYTFSGSIDLNETYIDINGSRWWSGVDNLEYKKNPNGHLFYDISQKDQVDEIFASTGMAWFYGVDTANERVFLPRNNYFEQATGDVSEVGQSVEAGLPNITGNTVRPTYGSDDLTSGAFYGTSKTHGRFQGDSGGSWYARGTGFDASLSSSIYKDDVDTVQPNAVKKLLYICVGNTVSDTSWVDVVTQVNGGVKDLEDKTNEGIEALSNASNALRQTQITNCLLEVPQRIKLELADGTLTLKAGSEVIVPNGFEADGTTPKFDYVTIENDLTRQGNINPTSIIYYSGSSITHFNTSYVYSGSTAPTLSTKYGFWYDTANNLVKLTNDKGVTWTGGKSFPLCIVSSVGLTEGADIASIDQVFNGMGYIGSTIWVDKGVKGLIPNGRNADGTLNNIEYTTKFQTYNKTSGNTSNANVFFLGEVDGKQKFTYCQDRYTFTVKTQSEAEKLMIDYASSSIIIYIEDENKVIAKSSTNIKTEHYITQVLSVMFDTNYNVTSFQPKQPFRAVDFNSTSQIVETYQNGTSWYRIWSPDSTGKRWCVQGGVVGSDTGNYGTMTVNLLKSFKDTDYTLVVSAETTVVGDFTNTGNCSIRVATFLGGAHYNKTKKSFDCTTRNKINWQACGYLE